MSLGSVFVGHTITEAAPLYRWLMARLSETWQSKWKSCHRVQKPLSQFNGVFGSAEKAAKSIGRLNKFSIETHSRLIELTRRGGHCWRLGPTENLIPTLKNLLATR